MLRWAVRASGRFLPEAVAAPVASTHDLARPWPLPLVRGGEVPGQLATEPAHVHRMRASLGGPPVAEAARTRLAAWLTQRATADLPPRDLVTRAEAILRAWQIGVPAPSPLADRIVAVPARVPDASETRSVLDLSPDLQPASAGLWQVAPRERPARLGHRKASPPEARSAVLLRSSARGGVNRSRACAR